MTSHFGVFLRMPKAAEELVRFVEIEAETRHLAVRMIEARMPGWEIYAVTIRAEVIGHCQVCRAVLFNDERARAGPRCFEC